MKNVISVKDLSVSYSQVEAINNITFNINQGEFVCILGPNGGGKTTLLNTILGFLKPDSGTVLIFGEKIRKAYSKISYVPQIALMDRSFPITVIETVMTAFLKKGLHPLKRYNKNEKLKAYDILKLVGLEKCADKLVSELSGGEFQRMLIARALVAEPEIILLDEPTANVDPNSRNIIFSLMSKLSKSGITVVTVTHDLDAAVSMADRIICIKREMIYDGNTKLDGDRLKLIYGNDFNIGGGTPND